MHEQGMILQFSYSTPSAPAQGWVCPKCGAVYAPGVKGCDLCNWLAMLIAYEPRRSDEPIPLYKPPAPIVYTTTTKSRYIVMSW
jgi:hypothetical protein